MNKKAKDGGLAFPTELHGYGGMSLRDYLAAHAPIGVKYFPFSPDTQKSMEENSRGAYLWADAMLKAREEAK